MYPIDLQNHWYVNIRLGIRREGACVYVCCSNSNGTDVWCAGS